MLRPIELLHGIDPMTERDARAGSLSGALDLDEPNFAKLIRPYRRDCPYDLGVA